jgi:rsbT antagonist protein RsbS
MQGGTHIPIIKLYDTLIVTIQVELSDSIVMQLKDDIGDAIQDLGPRGLIMDVSGVEIIDSYISRAIRDIGLIAQLMGVEAVISGLDPNIALTLIEMGMGLEGVKTYLNLESAYEAINDGSRPGTVEPHLGRGDADAAPAEERGWWWE